MEATRRHLLPHEANLLPLTKFDADLSVTAEVVVLADMFVRLHRSQ